MNKLGRFERITDVYCRVLSHKLDLIRLTMTLMINSEKIATNEADGKEFRALILILETAQNPDSAFIGLDSNLENGLKIKCCHHCPLAASK